MTWFEWLGLKRPEVPRVLRPLQGLGGSILLALAIFGAVIGCVFAVRLTVAVLGTPWAETDGDFIRNAGLALAALFGLPFLIWRTTTAARQADIADAVLLNERVNAAALGLGARRQKTEIVGSTATNVWENDNVTCAAAIDQLQGIASEQPNLAPRISRLLATFVRGNYPRKSDDLREIPFNPRVPEMELQYAVDALSYVHSIARRADPGQWRLDLRECDFDGVNFRGGNFFAADFTGSRFEASDLSMGDFRGCWFHNTLISYCSFYKSSLTGAKFDRSKIRSVRNSLLGRISLRNNPGLTFIAADLSKLHSLGTTTDMKTTFRTLDTKLSGDLRIQLPNNDKHITAILYGLDPDEEIDEATSAIIREVEEAGFSSWSPYTSNDYANGELLQRHYKKLGLLEWPYWET